ncbi:MAG: hypothetical protein ACOYM3_07605 [Terrimicrobiaceae bacterium]
MKPKTALCTIVVGAPYLEAFDRYSRKRFEDYARRHGYDPIILTEPVRDLPGRKLTWQKLCLQDLSWWREYDQVAFIDADILIARDAPALPVVPEGKIAAVPDKLPHQINSGVLVYHPDDAIQSLFEESLLDPDPFWDQRALTRVMLYRHMEKLLDRRFNRQFYFNCWSLWGSLFRRQWFYHACHGKIKLPFIANWLRFTFR